jgi:hypothetical protein
MRSSTRRSVTRNGNKRVTRDAVTKSPENEDSRAAGRRVRAWVKGLTAVEQEAFIDLIWPLALDIFTLLREAQKRVPRG